MIETILNNFHLEKILWIVKKRLAFMIIFAMLGGVLGGVYASVTNRTHYTASVSFYVYSNPDYVYDSSVNISNTEFTLAKNLVQSYTLVLKSNTVLKKVIEATGLPYSATSLAGNIASQQVEGTAIFYVFVYDSNPYNAMVLANAIADIAPTEISRIVKSGGIEVVDYATLPQVPYSSNNIMKYVILGIAGGGGLSAVIFLFFGLLDTTIRRKYEIDLAFNIPFLGSVPLISGKGKSDTKAKQLSEESPFALRESYNAIRTNILFTGKGDKCPSYVITSAEQGEGKSLNCINLAISYSQMGKRVLVVDGDMRKGTLSDELGFEEEIGLSQYLAGISKGLKQIELRENLFVVPSGFVPPNPSELISSDKMKSLLEELKGEYDCIFIDMPPVGIVSDAMQIADAVTGYVLIARVGVTKMNKLRTVVQVLEQINACISGIVFNAISPKSQDYTYRKYGDRYEYRRSE